MTDLFVEVNLVRNPLPFIPDQAAVRDIHAYGQLTRHLGPRTPPSLGGCPPPVYVAQVVLDEAVPAGAVEFRDTINGRSKQMTIGYPR